MRNEAKFHADRLTGIGGSDAPVILGLSPYMTPLELWAVKTGVIEGSLNYDKLVGNSEQRDMGRKLQPLIIEVFKERTGREIETVDEDLLIRNPEHPWLIGHLDAWQNIQGIRSPLEIKNVIIYKRDAWQDHAPIEAQVQLHHYMMVTDSIGGSIASLIGGFQFRYDDIDYNEKFAHELFEREEEFWEKHVLADIPPRATARDNRFLNYLIPAAPKTVVQLPSKWFAVDQKYLDVCRQLDDLDAQAAPLKEEKALLEARIKQEMGEHEEAHIDGGGVWTFKQINRKGYEVAPTSYRRLTRKGDRTHG